jgi:hypothetical protein
MLLQHRARPSLSGRRSHQTASRRYTPLSEIGAERWQYDLWFQIIRADLDGHPEQVDLTYHPAPQLPAMSRYAVTTPALE